MSSSGAVGAALLLCVAVAASASSVFYPGQQFLDESSSSEYGVLVMGSNVHGKLDIFLDLSDPQSAKAWPTLKRAVQDSEDTMEFVFHAIPLVADPIAVDYAKAAYVIAEHSGDAEVETFFDLVFSSQSSRERKKLAGFQYDTNGDTIINRVSQQEAGDSISDLEGLNLLAALVQSSSSMDSHQYESGMRDAFDDLLRQGKTSSSPSSTLSTYVPIQGGTPAVYLDGEFMAYLDGEEALENFKLFLSSGLLSKISDANHLHGGVGTRCPLWLKLQDVLGMLDDVRQQERDDHDTKYDQRESYHLYADSEGSSGAVAAGGAAYDDDTTLRSSDDFVKVAFSVKSAGVVADDDDETSAPVSPSSPGTLSRYSSNADFYLYDDTTGGEVRQEQQAAAEDGGKRLSLAALQQMVNNVAAAEQVEPLLPPRSPSSVVSGHGVSDELKERETKQQQISGSDLLPPFSLSPPAQVIA